MKQFIRHSLLAILFAILFAACSTSRKLASETSQTHVTTSVSTDTHTQTNVTDAVGVRTTETDLSNAVIEFTKIEYFDGSTSVTTTDTAKCGTSVAHDREATEPPNASRNTTNNVKSVTFGSVTLNKDKKKETDTNINHAEATQTDEAVEAEQTEDSNTKTVTEEKPKRGFFFWLGVFSSIAVCIFIVLKIRKAYINARKEGFFKKE